MEIRKNNALLRFHYKIDPTTLSDSEWCKMVMEMEFVFEYMGLLNKEIKLG